MRGGTAGHRGAIGDRQLPALGAHRSRSRHSQADRPHQRRGLRHCRRRAQRFTGTTAIIGSEYYLPLGVHDAIESDFDARRSLSDLRSPQPLADSGWASEARLTRAQADEQLKVVAAAHEQAYPDDNKNQDLLVRPLDRLGVSTNPQDDTQFWVPMGLLQGLAGTVLLTSCINLANMMLAFGSAGKRRSRSGSPSAAPGRGSFASCWCRA